MTADLFSEQSTPPARDVYTVSRLNREARSGLEQHFGSVWISGELSNLARPASGHLYFSLKDSNAQIRCAMFRMRNVMLDFDLRNGLEILALARVTLYEARGEFQLVIEHMEPAGEGALRLRFDALKVKLEAEGLFASEQKKPLPADIRQLGVVTSPSGAAIHDVLTVIRRRYPALSVLIYPVAVQGEAAAGQIVDALTLAGRRDECDALLLTRGGGSLEDLWPFNEEAVARAIAACPIPVVSAVGHEVDNSISDLVADARAATPSAAAELLTPDGEALRQRLARAAQNLSRGQRRNFAQRQALLQSAESHLARQTPLRQLEWRAQHLDRLGNELERRSTQQLRTLNDALARLQQRLRTQGPAARLRQFSEQLSSRQHALQLAMAGVQRGQRARVRLATDTLQRLDPALALQTRHTQLGKLADRLLLAQQRYRDHCAMKLSAAAHTLSVLGPEAVLQRGYTLTTDPDSGHLVRHDQLAIGDKIRTRFASGSLISQVSKLDNTAT